MKIIFLASECAPIAKVGGLADVVGSLPKALKKLGADVAIAIPFYGAIKKGEDFKIAAENLSVTFEGKAKFFNLWQTHLPSSDVPVLLIENDIFAGDIYLEKDASSGGSEKEISRFLFLSVCGMEAANFLKADILHCHDWHTAIVPYLNKQKGGEIKTILTIHNLGYQGVYSNEIVNRCLNTNFSEDINCLKMGILNADLVTTVSPSYAEEILTDEFGFGLQEYLQKRKGSLLGIINGVDEEIFNPAADPYLETTYDSKNIEGKNANKASLQKKFFQMDNLKIPILGMISRLAEQKGMDLVIQIFQELMKENIQFILLGQGVQEYENFFKRKMKEFPQKFSAKFEFDEKLAHQIYAGADMFLMPSHFEPCGLGQQIAMIYGALPVARAVGGIKDTVNKETGFLFEKYDAQEFFAAIKTALQTFKNKELWRKMQANAMNQNFSWEKSAKIYLSLYKNLSD